MWVAKVAIFLAVGCAALTVLAYLAQTWMVFSDLPSRECLKRIAGRGLAVRHPGAGWRKACGRASAGS